MNVSWSASFPLVTLEHGPRCRDFRPAGGRLASRLGSKGDTATVRLPGFKRVARCCLTDNSHLPDQFQFKGVQYVHVHE
jgi:hypothetical protein